MKKKEIKKEYRYNFLIGFLFIWTIIVGFSFMKITAVVAMEGYEYMIAEIGQK